VVAIVAPTIILTTTFNPVVVDGFAFSQAGYPKRTLNVATVTEVPGGLPSSSSSKTTTTTTTALFATKKKKKKRPTSAGASAGGGFGGAALEPCPCGSGETYTQCCGRLHKDSNVFRQATPADVVRARYSAYARKDADFLMSSTHPKHKDYNGDNRSTWKETIKTNMYDKFDFTKCVIVKEEMKSPSSSSAEQPESDQAIVQFIAEMTLRATGEVTSFMETSTFERSGSSSSSALQSAWLYRDGLIEAVPTTVESGDSENDNISNDDSLSSTKDLSIEEKLSKLL
jgi:uncharacterized protein YchJ